MGEQVIRGRGWWLAAGGLGGRTALWLLLIVAAIAAADRSRAVLDLSADHRFTLAPELARLIDQQRTPIELVGIWSSVDDDALQPVAHALALMAARNHLLTWQRIDPELHKPRLEAFAQGHGGARAQGIYVCSGERARLIPLSWSTRLVLQPEVGGALLALSDPHPPRAVLLQGHGELRRGGGPTDGCEELEHALKWCGMEVTLDDGSRELSPEVLVVLAGPSTRALGESMLAKLAQHLRDGGSLLVAADDSAPPDLCFFLRQRGIMVGSGFLAALFDDQWDGRWDGLLDPKARTFPPMILHSHRHHFEGQDASFPYHRLLLRDAPGEEMINASHPASQEVARNGARVLSPRSSEVEVVTARVVQQKDAETARRFDESGLSPRNATWLLSTLPEDSWRQPFSSPLQSVPPDGAPAHALAYAAEYRPGENSANTEGVGARVVVWGSREALSNGVLAQAEFANADLLRSMAGWLSKRSAPTDIPPSRRIEYQTALSDGALWTLLGILVGVVPCVLLGGAMLTWWDRR